MANPLYRCVRDLLDEGDKPAVIHEAVADAIRAYHVERDTLRTFRLTNIEVFEVEVMDPELDIDQVREAWNVGDIERGEAFDGHIEIEEVT